MYICFTYNQVRNHSSAFSDGHLSSDLKCRIQNQPSRNQKAFNVHWRYQTCCSALPYYGRSRCSFLVEESHDLGLEPLKKKKSQCWRWQIHRRRFLQSNIFKLQFKALEAQTGLNSQLYASTASCNRPTNVYHWSLSHKPSCIVAHSLALCHSI